MLISIVGVNFLYMQPQDKTRQNKNYTSSSQPGKNCLQISIQQLTDEQALKSMRLHPERLAASDELREAGAAQSGTEDVADLITYQLGSNTGQPSFHIVLQVLPGKEELSRAGSRAEQSKPFWQHHSASLSATMTH